MNVAGQRVPRTARRVYLRNEDATRRLYCRRGNGGGHAAMVSDIALQVSKCPGI